MTKPMTPAEIKERCARAICAPCQQGVLRVFEIVRTGNTPDKDVLAWVHHGAEEYRRACIADGIFKIPDEELS